MPATNGVREVIHVGRQTVSERESLPPCRSLDRVETRDDRIRTSFPLIFQKSE